MFQGSGKITFNGCARIASLKFYNYQYSVGTVVYLKYKAAVGIIEKIFIKKIIMSQINGTTVFLYQDMLNSLYNETDLCLKAEAISLATNYIQSKRSSLSASISC